jgi:hypothetical protein
VCANDVTYDSMMVRNGNNDGNIHMQKRPKKRKRIMRTKNEVQRKDRSDIGTI